MRYVRVSLLVSPRLFSPRHMFHTVQDHMTHRGHTAAQRKKARESQAERQKVAAEQAWLGAVQKRTYVEQDTAGQPAKKKRATQEKVSRDTHVQYVTRTCSLRHLHREVPHCPDQKRQWFYKGRNMELRINLYTAYGGQDGRSGELYVT